MKKIQYNGESKLLSGIATKINWLIDQVGTKIDASEKGVANGVATLDGGGKVPSSQLPSYVDDVIEGYYYNDNFYSDSAHTELITPETSKIYVDLPTNKSYRWGGSEYVEISSGAVQSDWNQNDSSQLDYILNKPNVNNVAINHGTYFGGTIKPMAFTEFFLPSNVNTYYQGIFRASDVWKYVDNEGTTSVIGDCHLRAGNWLTSGQEWNAKGYIGVYDESDHTAELTVNGTLTASRTYYLPDKDGTLALVSDLPTNPVLWSEQNVLGAKNIIPYPYREMTVTKNGLTFTVNADYSVNVSSGSPSGNTNWYYCYRATWKAGTYILSGYADTAQGNNFCLRAVINQDLSGSRTYNDYGEGVEVTVNEGEMLSIYLHMGTSGVSSNKNHYAMIRPSTIADATYQEPTLTNRQLTNDKISRDEYVASGVKNYFKYPFYPHPIGVEQYTQRGVLFTDNGDGGLKADGVNNNEGNSYCQLIPDSVLYPSQFLKLPKGKYHFSGGISADYYLNLSWGLETSPTSRTVIGTDHGDGFDFEVTEEQSKNNIYVSFAFVKQGKTADNVVFYPSITRLEDRDSGYVNYAMTNLQLTNNKVDKEGYILDDEDLNDLIYPGFYLARNNNNILNKPSGFNQFALIVSRTASSSQYYNQRLIRPNEDGEVYSRNCVNGTWTSWVKEYSIWNSDNYLGVKNFVPYRYYNNSGIVSNGVTFTVNTDGSISCSGTSTGNAVFNVTQREVNGGLFLPNGTYVLSGCPEGGSTSTSAGAYQMIVSRTSGNAQVNYVFDAGSGASFTVNGDDFSNDGAWVRIYIVCRRTVVSDTLVFKPMVRKSAETDTAFVSPADSNRKLSAERLNTDEIAPSENSSTASKAYAVGDYMIRNGKLFRVTTAITSGGSIISSGDNANIVKTTLGAELKSALT